MVEAVAAFVVAAAIVAVVKAAVAEAFGVGRLVAVLMLKTAVAVGAVDAVGSVDAAVVEAEHSK